MIARYRSAIERSPAGHCMIARSSAPSPVDLAELNQRAQALQAALSPTSADTAERRVAKLFLMFPTAGLAGDNGKAVVEAYAGVLKGFPIWAIDRACQKIIASGATFRPSAPEIRKLVVAECDRAYEELDAIRVVTMAEVYDPPIATERDRVKVAFAQLVAQLDPHAHRRRKTREEAERDVENGFAHLQGPVALGDGLMAVGARS